jgi:hypothetical protein
LPWLGYFVSPISLGSGKGVGPRIRSILKDNMKVIASKVKDKKLLAILGADVASAFIEKSLLGENPGVDDVIAKVVTDVAGGLVEGGKLQTKDIEANVKDALISVSDTLSETIASRPAPPDVSYTNAGG